MTLPAGTPTQMFVDVKWSDGSGGSFDVLNPSAENLAKYFYDETNRHLNGKTSGRVWVKDITIWETDTTTATYSE